jgi:3-oxoacyl-[acyl-carrier-protein] synthase III
MLSSAPRAAVLCGLGSWASPNIVTNESLVAVLDTSDEWMRRKKGMARPATVPEVAARAQSTTRALELAEWPVFKVDWLICQ